MTKALFLLQSGMRPSAQEFLHQESNKSDCRVALPCTSEQSTAPAAAAAEIKVKKSSVQSCGWDNWPDQPIHVRAALSPALSLP